MRYIKVYFTVGAIFTSMYCYEYFNSFVIFDKRHIIYIKGCNTLDNVLHPLYFIFRFIFQILNP